jgi:hypothetical protein
VAIFTDTGRKWVIDKMRESIAAGTTMKYLAWGTGATAEAVGNTALATEASEARTAGAITGVTTTVTGDTHRVIGTITVAGANKTITEVGLFDASAAGIMLMRALFTGLALLIGDSIAFTIDFKEA